MNGRPQEFGSKEIFVDFEYGSLKEVIVGVPFAIYPDLEVARWAQEAIRYSRNGSQEDVERSGRIPFQLANST